MWKQCYKCKGKTIMKLDNGGRMRKFCVEEEKFLTGKEPDELECFMPREQEEESKVGS